MQQQEQQQQPQPLTIVSAFPLPPVYFRRAFDDATIADDNDQLLSTYRTPPPIPSGCAPIRAFNVDVPLADQSSSPQSGSVAAQSSLAASGVPEMFNFNTMLPVAEVTGDTQDIVTLIAHKQPLAIVREVARLLSEWTGSTFPQLLDSLIAGTSDGTAVTAHCETIKYTAINVHYLLNALRREQARREWKCMLQERVHRARELVERCARELSDVHVEN